MQSKEERGTLMNLYTQESELIAGRWFDISINSAFVTQIKISVLPYSDDVRSSLKAIKIFTAQLTHLPSGMYRSSTKCTTYCSMLTIVVVAVSFGASFHSYSTTNTNFTAENPSLMPANNRQTTQPRSLRKGLPTCKTKTLMRLSKNCLKLFGQFWAVCGNRMLLACYSHASFSHRPTSVRSVLANQTPPFTLITMHIIGRL